MLQNAIKKFIKVVPSVLLAVSSASAEVTDHGGNKFSGRGDRIAPRCSFDVPTAASAPFFIQWSCSDDNATADEIQTELWIYRKGSTAGKRVESFLGFPASVLIDEAILQVENFSDGIPLSFRLVARDTAGNAMVSELRAVFSQDNTLDSCDLSIVTEATESTDTATGIPSLSVIVQNATVTTDSTTPMFVRVSTPTVVNANPCEIDSICNNDGRVLFEAALDLGDDGTATGEVLVTPPLLTSDVRGSATVNNSVLNALDVSGSTTIGGVESTITLNCTNDD